MRSAMVSEMLQDGSSKLIIAGSESPLLDCRILLAHAFKVPVDSLYSMYRDQVPEPVAEQYQKLIKKRSMGLPVAYLTGFAEFYGRRFLVDSRVLVPRPETELLVDEAIRRARDIPSGTILDTCTGSGCVAISLKAELPAYTVLASDISDDALAVARENAQRLVDGQIHCIHSDGVPESFGPYALITANPPYVPTRDCPRKKGSASSIDSPVWEPAIALDGGNDGLEIVTRIASEAFTTLKLDGWFITEIGYDQSDRIRERLARIGYADVSFAQDLAGHFRVVSGRKTNTRSA